MRRILIVSFCLMTGSWTLAQQQTPAPNAPPELTLQAIFAEGGITGRGPETIQWSPDSTKVSFVQRDDSGEHGQLWYIDAASGNKAVLVAESKLQSLAPPASQIKDERKKEWVQRYSVAAYQWTPDSKHLLFDSQGQLWYYSLDTGTAVQLTSSTDASTDPKFSPDGKRLAFVRKHDLWVHQVGSDVEADKRITTDGDENLLNGEVDWLYAEELSVRSNYFWSPDGKRIAFLQMNEKNVPVYPIVDWMSAHPSVSQEKYPKAGDPNPEVRVGVVSPDGGKVRWISVGEGKDKDIYIPRFGWIREGLLYIVVANRLQTQLDLYFVDAVTGRSRLMLRESEPDTWVLDESTDIKVLKSGDGFLWPSWRDGYTHLYLYSFDKGNPLVSDAKLVRQLTKGEFEVSGIAGIDDVSGTVYVDANADDPRQQQVYAVKLTGGPMQKISAEDGTHRATFAPNGRFFVDNYSAVMSPPRLSFCTVGASCNIVWQARTVNTYDFVAPKGLELKAADGVTKLYGRLLLPPGATGQATTPVILNPYGGPAGQSVVNAWGGAGFLFDQIMLRNGFAVLVVDNRGTPGRGKKFVAASRHDAGKVELADQLAALDQVLAQYPVLDGQRIGWWGWSYGGYLTLYAMTHSDRIKAGVAGAPVTDWHLYDSTYTERYMGLPKDNAAGYQSSSDVLAAANLKGRLLEVHGTSDDNVHLQNTIQMIQRLITAGKQFDLQLYPGKTHGVTGTAERVQLYQRILDHFDAWVKRAR